MASDDLRLRPSDIATSMVDTVASIADLATEARNPVAKGIDALDATGIALLMNSQDATIASIVLQESDAIGKLMVAIAARLRGGGRLIFSGAGTSGRLGVLDAAECVPTFQSPVGQIAGLIAGGIGAMFRAVDGAEDSVELGAKDLQHLGLDERDCVVGIAASGRTPYVLGSIAEARRVGALTGAIACCKGSRIGSAAEFVIEVETGPEVLMGSTRLRAGTATKLILNTLTTGTMILIGKTMGDLMVDLNPSNGKLRLRAVRIVALAAEVTIDAATAALEAAGGEVKTAIVCLRTKVAPEIARCYLSTYGGRVALALKAVREGSPQMTPSLPRSALASTSSTVVAVGIDGGCTALKLRLSIRQYEDDGKTWLRTEVSIGRPALLAALGPDGVAFEWRRRIYGDLDRALGRRIEGDDEQITISAIVAGTSGAGTTEARAALTSSLSALFPRTAAIGGIRVISDVQLLSAASGSASTLCLIAGTGSIAWWEPDADEPGVASVIRAGGFGPGVDEGSGLWVASEGVRAVCKAEDGRGPTTSLARAMFAAAQLAPSAHDARSLAIWFATMGASAASLAQVVLHQASAGDVVALRIRTEAVLHLVSLARTVMRRGNALFVAKTGGASEVVLAAGGGLFADAGLWADFTTAWTTNECGPTQTMPLNTTEWSRIANPVDGAIILAEEMSSRALFDICSAE